MGIFNYESKFMQTMLLVADYMILNLVYLICCIPIVTIGAAQAGLYSGIKTLLDKDDGTPCLRSFFKGFKTGFLTITLVWTIFALIIAALLYYCGIVLYVQGMGFKPQLWMVLLALAICMIYQANLTIFHANFGCTALQLIRNVFYTTLAHPIRTVIIAVLTWLPIAAFLIPPLLQLSPIIFICYYSVAFLINSLLMKKPYNRLAQNFMDAQEPQVEEAPIEVLAETVSQTDCENPEEK